MSEYAFEGPVRASSTVTWSFETQTLAGDGAFPFSSAIGDAYQATVLAAFAKWSAVSGLSFVQVPDSSSAAIRIGFGNFSLSNEIGETEVRSRGGVLSNDTVVRLLDPASYALTLTAGGWVYTPANVSLYQVALHEIGHAIGLDHTTDPTTVMYPVSTTSNPDLAPGDIWGANALYPLFTVQSLTPSQEEGAGAPVSFSFAVTRYGDPSLALSVNYAVTGAAATLAGAQAATGAAFLGGNLPTGQVTFAAGASTATVTVQTVGNTVPGPDLGFALTLTSTAAGIAATTRGANTATVLDDDGGGPGAVYRFFDTKDGTHFYTDSEAERNAVIATRSDLSYEGVQLHALTDPNAPGATPVFRFFDTTYGTHFYTDSAAERATVQATRPDLIDEGVAFTEYAGPVAGAAPVYRFFEQSNGTHFYSDSPSELAGIAASRPDLVNEGVAFYAPTS